MRPRLPCKGVRNAGAAGPRQQDARRRRRVPRPGLDAPPRRRKQQSGAAERAAAWSGGAQPLLPTRRQGGVTEQPPRGAAAANHHHESGRAGRHDAPPHGAAGRNQPTVSNAATTRQRSGRRMEQRPQPSATRAAKAARGAEQSSRSAAARKRRPRPWQRRGLRADANHMYGTERERRGAAVPMTACATHPCTSVDRTAAAVAPAAAALEPTSIHGGTGEVVSSIELGRYDDGTARYRPLLRSELLRSEAWSNRNSWQPRHNSVDCNGELQTTSHAALHAPHTPLQFTRAARAPPRERSPHPDRRYAPARPPMHYTHDPEPASRVQWWSDTGMVQRGSGQYRQRSRRSSRTRGRVRTRD